MTAFPVSPCLRSGFCCKQATCVAGVVHGAPSKGCTFLRGDRPGEYSCGLVVDGVIDPKELYIGDGCSSTLFNTDRDKARALLKEKRALS